MALSTAVSGLTMSIFQDANGTANIWYGDQIPSIAPSTIATLFTINPSPNFGIYQPEVRRTTKSVSITASLKGFNVSFYGAHGGVKASEFTKDELVTALPDLLAKLTKEPKED